MRGSSRAEPEKLFKESQILDVDELPEVPLDIGFEIIAQGLSGIESLVVNPWIKPRQQELVNGWGIAYYGQLTDENGRSFRSAVRPASDWLMVFMTSNCWLPVRINLPGSLSASTISWI